MSEPNDQLTDRYLRGDLTPAEARQLAQHALDRRGLFEDLTLTAVSIHGVAAQPAADSLDMYVSGRLSPPEQRGLAQAALADDELFDTLAAHGAAEQSLGHPTLQTAKVVPISRKGWFVAAAAIAAAVVAVAIYLRPHASQSAPTSAGPALAASLDPASQQPILLSRDLTPADTGTAPVFRGAEPNSRAPKPEGSIVATDNFEVNIDLGSLDGLTKGAKLEVSRGGQAVGSLEATTVFRDHARAHILTRQSVHANDTVRAAPAVYLGAVLEQMNAESPDAPKIGRDALSLARSTNVAPSETRAILQRLAQFDYKNGDLNAAAQDYQSLVDTFASPPPASTAEQDAAFNAWGSLLALRGDRAEAEAKFRQTHDAQGLNNAGVIAELRGETANAQALYEAALRILDKSPSASARDRQSIEANLARLSRGAHASR